MESLPKLAVTYGAGITGTPPASLAWTQSADTHPCPSATEGSLITHHLPSALLPIISADAPGYATP